MIKFDLTVFRRIVRPTRECPLEVAPDAATEEPILLYGAGERGIEEFARVAPLVGFGAAVALFGIDDEQWVRAHAIAEANVFRDWFRGKDMPGLPADARTWVKSEYDGKTYSTHLPYLLEAVRRTTGPVLELGAGAGWTPALHEECVGKRLLITVDSDFDWLARAAEATHARRVDIDVGSFMLVGDTAHHFECCVDPAATKWIDIYLWAVVFVDHSPGETRGKAINRARDRAEYVVVHDTEDLGYGIEELLSTFKYRKDFRRARPWTTVVSMTKEIW